MSSTTFVSSSIRDTLWAMKLHVRRRRGERREGRGGRGERERGRERGENREGERRGEGEDYTTNMQDTLARCSYAERQDSAGPPVDLTLSTKEFWLPCNQ